MVAYYVDNVSEATHEIREEVDINTTDMNI